VKRIPDSVHRDSRAAAAGLTKFLRRAGGVTKGGLMERFGSLDHTTRGFISRLGDAGHNI
jgi:hypothetical protein